MNRVEPLSVAFGEVTIVYPYHLNIEELRPYALEHIKGSGCGCSSIEKKANKKLVELFAAAILTKARERYGYRPDSDQSIGVLKSRSTSEATALEVCKEIDPYCTSYIFGNRVVRELRRDLIDTIKAKKEHKEYWQAIQEDLREQRPLSRISEASNSSKDPSSSKSWFYENL